MENSSRNKGKGKRMGVSEKQFFPSTEIVAFEKEGEEREQQHDPNLSRIKS